MSQKYFVLSDSRGLRSPGNQKFAVLCRRVTSQFFLVSPDSQVNETLADPIIFRIIFYKSNGDEKKNKISFYNDGLNWKHFQPFQKV